MEECASKAEKMVKKCNGFMQSLGGKLTVIIIALLLLQIPLNMVKSLAEERQDKLRGVQSEIFSNWGASQRLTLIPEAAKTNFSAELNPEIRYRGIYQALVYTADVKLEGEYDNVGENQFAELIISDIGRVSDAKTTVNGKEVQIEKSGNTLKFPLKKGKSVVKMTLSLRGGSEFKITPNGTESNIVISGKWGSPSFIGNSLPNSRTIEKEYFSAEWSLGKFAEKPVEIGVNLNLPASTYQQVERSFNYATLFLIIFFCTVLVADAVTKANIHILQYLIASGAPVLFYLMSLAIGERIGFTAGYIVSAAVIVVMVTMYAKAFLAKIRPALVMGLIFAVSYAINFILLRMEDLALLSGTIVLAVVLAILMVLTGKMNRQQ